MFNFLEKRLQRSINKLKAKTYLQEQDWNEIIRDIKIALLEADVNLKVIKDFIDNVKQEAIGSEIIGKLNPSQAVIDIINKQLIKILGEASKDLNLNNKLNITMLVGLQGSGKTTTCSKLVNFLKNNQKIKKPLLVACDIYRPGAIEQLKILAKQINTECFYIEDKPLNIAKKAIEYAKNNDFDYVLIDTAGRLSINKELMDELNQIKKDILPNNIILVVDALSGQDAINVATTFHENLNLSGFIVTKLDSNTRGGAVLSLTYLLKLPIFFMGTGEKITNFSKFYPDRMASRILGLGDVLTLIEKAKTVTDEDVNQKLMKRMITGKFDLNDLLMQLEQMQKMGSLSKIIKLIPGLSSKINDDKTEKIQTRLEKFKILISSMTLQERKEPRLLKHNTRKQRIIKGSGRNAQEYNLLLNEFARMEKQFKEISKQIKSGTFKGKMF
ncbi:MAG: signal recognition particle protein [Mycoplasma sp.]|nr:signal recognition particle protein [Mycoplasma sp.]